MSHKKKKKENNDEGETERKRKKESTMNKMERCKSVRGLWRQSKEARSKKQA
jgi:hypothetical protein